MANTAVFDATVMMDEQYNRQEGATIFRAYFIPALKTAICVYGTEPNWTGKNGRRDHKFVSVASPNIVEAMRFAVATHDAWEGPKTHG